MKQKRPQREDFGWRRHAGSHDMLNIAIESQNWQDLSFEDLANRAVAQTLKHMGLTQDNVEISLLACDDARIAALNAQFRSKERPTNVLSWPTVDLSPEIEGHAPDRPEPDFDGTIELGDIAISYDTCAREAAETQTPLDAHTTHLIVHGMLHLLGYDHIRDHDATVMERLETEILGKLGQDDPYSN